MPRRSPKKHGYPKTLRPGFCKLHNRFLTVSNMLTRKCAFRKNGKCPYLTLNYSHGWVNRHRDTLENGYNDTNMEWDDYGCPKT